MRKAIAIFALLAASSFCAGQAAYIKAVDTKTITVSAAAFTHLNIIGELNVTVEYVISGSPATMSIVLQGCMRGNTCTTLNTYTSTSSGLVLLTGLYDQYVITPTFTGGSSPSVQINWLGTANSSPFVSAIPVPQASLANSATGAATALTATLAAAVNKTTYLTGFELTGSGATATSIITVTVTGVLGGTMSYVYVVPAGATVAAPNLFVSFPLPLPATGSNTAIVVNVPSFGSGNTNAAVTAQGFQQ